MTFVRLYQHRQKGANAEIDAAPADVEGLLPLLARIGEQAAAAADARIVEQQVILSVACCSASSSRNRSNWSSIETSAIGW